jgi:hypothetical protein
MREHPFTSDELAPLTAAVQALEGTESEEQVVIHPPGRERGHGRFDLAHLDEEYCVYVEWVEKIPFELLGLPLPEGHEIYDTHQRSATIGFGSLDAASVAELFTRWAPLVFADAPLVWSATAEA